MEKEQESIEIAKKFTKMDFSNPMGWTGYYDTELKELSQAIETVLNMLKEKDNIIKGKETVIETQAENEEVLLNTLKKKDKQIDIMARAFKQDDERTVEEIKQYFKEIAERKSEEC